MGLRLVSGLLAVVAVITMSVNSYGFQDKKGKDKKGHGHSGVISEVKMSGGKGSITITPDHHKGKDKAKASGKDKAHTYTVDLNTKVGKHDDKETAKGTEKDTDPARF